MAWVQHMNSLNAVHADEGGPLVAGNGIVEQPVFVQKPDLQRTLHQHTACDAAQCGGRAHQHAAAAAQQGTDGIEPPQAAGAHPAAHLGAQHGGKAAEQQGQKQQGRGPAQLDQTLLDEHLGQVGGHADDGGRYDEPGRQRGGAQGPGTVLCQPDELAGQLVERLLFPVGLRFGDDGLFHQHRGKRGNALKGGAQQVKAGKAQKAF